MHNLANIVVLNLLLVILPIFGCFSEIGTTSKVNLPIISSEIDLWVNNIPGVKIRQPLIHLKGKIIIKNIGDIKIENLKLKNIYLIQNRMLVSIDPANLNSTGDIINILPNEENIVSLNYNKIMPENIINYDSTVTLVFNFSAAGISFSDSLKNKIIRKVN